MKTISIVTILLILTSFNIANSAPAIGSRENPIPMGTSAIMRNDIFDNDDVWEITVLDVLPNATDEMLYPKDSFMKYTLDPGEEYFIAKIQAKYVGKRSNYFESKYLKAVGSASIGYNAIDNVGSASTIPGYIPYQEVFNGGVITGIVLWIIPSTNANQLVMYDIAADFDKRIYMALF